MFSVRFSRINGIRARFLRWVKKKHIVRTPSESYGMDSTVNYMRGVCWNVSRALKHLARTVHDLYF